MHNYTQDDFPLQEEIFSVKALNMVSRSVLERHFEHIWVKGEISNLAQPQSGHIYFTLKDADAQIRCAMFKRAQRGIDFKIKDGIEILVQGTVSIYPDRGDYQLIASKMHIWGEGQLQQDFEALKQKLDKAGLFAANHKQTLPQYPQHIGIISSATGDALQDILRILKERYPIAPITVYPTLVQGKQAAPSIVKAIGLANHHKKADVLILARGGGSLEDLWGFNEENVAHAIFESQLPIVTGIGHEMDFTIADFVADLRAPTPTAAAQSIVPDQIELISQFGLKLQQLNKSMQRYLDYQQLKLDHLQKNLTHPKNRVEQNLEKLAYISHKLNTAIKQKIQTAESSISNVYNTLMYLSPNTQISKFDIAIVQLQKQLQSAIFQNIQTKENHFKQLAETLHTISPLQTLSRGYAIVTDAQTGTPIKSAKNISIGQKIKTQFETNHIMSEVSEITAES
jgi:exodeoxyribonuclease VII large subunit